MHLNSIIRVVLMLVIPAMAAAYDGEVIRLEPQIRIVPEPAGSNSIPLADIRPFFAYARALEANDLDSAPHVINFADEHIVAGAGDVLYTEPVAGNEITYLLYRPGKSYKDAHTGELLGYEGLYVGIVSLESAGDPSVFKLIGTLREANIGDRLLVAEPEPLLPDITPIYPALGVTGSIIGVIDGVTQIGQYQVVVIDRGLRNGLKPGHVLRIVQDAMARSDVFENPTIHKHAIYPPEDKGRLMIIRSYEKLSYALIMDTRKPVHVFDKVTAP